MTFSIGAFPIIHLVCPPKILQKRCLQLCNTQDKLKTNVMPFIHFFGGGGWEGGKQRRYIMANQCAKKVVSNGTGLLDFAIVIVKYLFNLPDGQVKFLGEFKLQKNCI